MLKHYFRLDNLKAQAAAIQSGQHSEYWLIGHHFTDRSTAVLWPQLLDLVDSINSAPDQQTREIYAETAARVFAISMVRVAEVSVEYHHEALVRGAQSAHQATSDILERAANGSKGKK